MLNKILKTLIYLIIVLIPILFLPFTFEFLEFNKLFVLYFLVWLAVLFWLAKMIIKDKEIKIKFSKIDILVLSFVLVNVISYFFSVDKISSLLGYYGRFSTGIITLISFAMFYFLIKNLIGNKEEPGLLNTKTIVKCLLGANIFIILIAFLRLLGMWTLLDINNWMVRVSTTGSSIESLGMWLVITTILSILTLLSGFKWLGDNEKNSLWKWVSMIGLIFGMILLIVIDSILVWTPLIIGLFVTIFFILKRKILKNDIHKLIIPIALIILSVLFVFVNFRTITGGGLKISQDSYLSFLPERIMSQNESWYVSTKSVSSGIKPAIIGNGPGTYFYSIGKFKPLSLNGGDLWAVRFDRAGNTFAESLANIGVLGFLLHIGIWLFALLWLFPFTRKIFVKKSVKKIDITTGFLLIILFVLTIVQFVYYQNHVLGLLTWLFLALAITKEDKIKQWKLKDSPEIMLVVETLLIILAILYIVVGFNMIKVYLAEVNYVRALNNPYLEKKIVLLERARLNNPKESKYLLVMSRVFFEGAKLSVINQEDPAKASQEIDNARIYCQAATAISPNKVNTWQELSNLYLDITQLTDEPEQFAEQSKLSLEKALELEPNNPTIYNELGNIALFLDNKDEAKDYYNQALESKDNYIPSSVSIARLMEEDQEIEQAIEKLELLKKNTAVNAIGKEQVHFHLGRLYYSKGRNEDAANEFINALRINPDYANALYSAGVVFEEIGNIDFAITALERVLELNPNAEEVKQRIERLKSGDLTPIVEEAIDE